MPPAPTASERETPAAGGYVGRSLLRVEDGALLVGAGEFVDDVDLPGQLHARVIRSPVAHGLISSLDVEAARARPDVVTVVTAADLADALRIPIRLAPSEMAENALQPPLARGTVRYVGEPIAVVVATSSYGAEDAADVVGLEIEPLPAVEDARRGCAEEAPGVHEHVPGNVVENVRATAGGDVDAIFAHADIVVRERLGVHRHTAVPLEARGLVAAVAEDGSLVVWGPAKVKHHNRRVLAELLGLPVERVRFIEPDVGGGFGVRGEFYPEDFLIPWLALSTGRPVKWIEDRAEHFVASNHSREQECEIEVAASFEGQLLALRAQVWVDLGAYVRTNGLVPATNVVSHLAGPYKWSAIDAESHAVLTNRTPTATYRGPGQYEAALHRERVLDLVARRARIDPAELRRRNLVPSSEMPYSPELEGLPGPVIYDSGDFPSHWDRLCEHTDYDRLRDDAACDRRGGRRVGIGTAAYVEAGGRGPYEWARVLADRGGGFSVRVGVGSVGQGIATALAQIAADVLRVAVERVDVSYQDTDLVTEGAGAFASRSVVFGGNAVAGAALDLLEQARAIGADRLGLAPEEVEVSDGVVRDEARPEREVAIADCGCEGAFRYEQHGRSFSMGAAMAVVELEPETGAVSVRRCVVACDVGRAVNPLIVEGQLVGAAAQGLGGILLEELVYDSAGQPLVTSFMDYLMPTAAEVPRIEALVLELSKRGSALSNPLGVKGAGEAGIVGVGAAVANAVADALGGATIVAELPITPERVLSLMRGVERR
ncbi:MAG: aerobic carbon-monoxide dehydrogenase large subunit [Solirubrobacteraceae bacterium]|nr:aerobic carbon-monoxide dehydrogenase large subunit [Solirubrobacteraceae bacterium]